MSAIDFRAILKMEREKSIQSMASRKVKMKEIPEPNVSVEDRIPTPKGYIIDGLPANIMYYPEFITEEQECQIIEDAHALSSEWIHMDYRRVQNHGGIPTMDRDGMIETPLPDFLADLSSLLVARQIFPLHAPANHCLLNEYDPGMGIAPHMDGPRYLANPGAAILSLNSDAKLNFYRRDPLNASLMQLIGSVLLEPRSLVHFEGDAFTTVFHGIDAVRDEEVKSCLNLHCCNTAGLHSITRRTRLSVTLRAARTTQRARELADMPCPSLTEELDRRSRHWIASIRDSAKHFNKGRSLPDFDYT